ncbi:MULTISPECIES: MFS transporter [unclassified Bacillus (in: firmicutes)]|uniref:MFS transporter n=1 Tax=unclassified Bacillus (in: firmicutes) TaxID=185979 RepID=UPI0008E49FCC|nr:MULTISPECIES: MFS transporter [unclassified Bacillus (in: firmicutes)]SFK03343.1 MFS transporter, PPP family, 3-phenylpropionic acid transporter [Bacillus sp. 71mf]SFT23017.1 MFS transporter, PPP family, 3-phenylpropionic acid transporter [Bacillus sp. 103mf]
MNTHRWMSIQFFSFFMTWGIFLPYWTGWMIHTKGITVPQASLIMSLGLVARGLSTLFAFPYLSGKFSSKTLLNGAGIGTLIAILCYIPASSFTSLLIVTLAFHLFYPTLMPALDSAAGVLVQSNQLKDYGRSRQWGSIGFVLAGMILSIFTGMLGDEVILWALLLGTGIFVCLGFMRAPVILSKKPQSDPTEKEGMLKLFHIKHFSLVLIIVILLQAAHASYYNYGYLFLQEIHAPKYLIGVIINIAVIAEIIFFSIADRKFQNFSVGSLLALAALGSSVRWILVFAFPNVIVFCIAQTLHACSFAMGHYAFMKYLVKNISHTQIPKAQGIYSALALSWSTAVFTIFGAYLYEIEPRYAFIGMIVCTIPSMLLALLYRKLELKKEILISI